MPDYSKIKLIVLDVDGTLTDGGIYYDSQGNEMKRFDVKDGLGIKLALAAGLEFAVITGRVSAMVERRMKELGIQHLMEGVQVKLPALKELMSECGFVSEQICYIGDDWNDLQAMGASGACMCPGDAADDVKKTCHYVAARNGGYGAVRDCIEHILKERSIWKETAENQYYA